MASGRKKSAINYSDEEDFLIAVAFVNITLDPIKGVGQKSDSFWTRIQEKFCLLQQKELDANDIIICPPNSIEQRWKKTIQKNVQLWNKHYRQLKSVPRSGWNEEMYTKEASKLFKSETGKQFRLEKCVPILQKLPKFDPMVVQRLPSFASTQEHSILDNDGDNDSFTLSPSSSTVNNINKKQAATAVTTNNSAPPQGSRLERPIGMKKAKMIKKLNESGLLLSNPGSASLKDNRDDGTHAEDEAIAEMTAFTKELVSVVKVAMINKKNEKHEKWLKMAQIYATCGNHVAAMELMKKIEDDDVQQEREELAMKKIADDNEQEQEAEELVIEKIQDDNEQEGEQSAAVAEAVLKEVEFEYDKHYCAECMSDSPSRNVPTSHQCRKCGMWICSTCCFEKRGLELVWWCGPCFDAESVTNQEQIRDGKYESDGDYESANGQE